MEVVVELRTGGSLWLSTGADTDADTGADTDAASVAVVRCLAAAEVAVAEVRGRER